MADQDESDSKQSEVEATSEPKSDGAPKKELPPPVKPSGVYTPKGSKGTSKKPKPPTIQGKPALARRVYEWAKLRAVWPKRGVKFADYADAQGNKRSTYISVVLTVILITAWVLMYFMLSNILMGVRVNSSILAEDISMGTALEVKAVSGDGGIVLKDGTTYSEGSYTTTVMVYSDMGGPYYIPEDKVLAAPADFVSYLKMTTKLWVYVGLTVLLSAFDRLNIRRQNHEPYYKVVQESYPAWLRFMRWGILGVGVVTVLFWFYPFL